MPAIPKKASTIILIREKDSGEFEVFLVRRHEQSSFMGGNYVYPGGRIDREDHGPEICSNCTGLTPLEAKQALGTGFSPEESLACWIAAVRELFEEAGILLAYDRKGDPLTLIDQDKKEWALAHREVLHQSGMTFCQILQKENLFLALDQVLYYAHWITPEARPQRFDTYFFIVRNPEGQEAVYDRKETTAGIWITPRKALEENLTGEVVLSPPTLKTLEDLSRFKTVDEVFNSLKDRAVQPILPVLTKISNEPVIIFPWDRDYERFQREESSGSAGHGRPSAPEDNTTRVVFREGRWLPYCNPETP